MALLVTLAALTAGSQELEAQSIRFQAPAGFRVDAPVLNSGSGYSYTVPAQWEYSDVRISSTSTSTAPTWEFVVDWNGTEVSAGHNLAASRTFTTSGQVDVKVRLEVSCPSSASGTSCRQINIYGVNYQVSKGETWASTWSETQTVLLPVAEDQYPTRVVEPEEAPPAIVEALGAVFGAIGVQDPDAKAHLWSIFICLLLAIGLAATCFGSTGGGPASVFLGAVAFFLVFSLAGPPAFGVPGVFAGLALLVPSLGLVVFAKTKVR